MTLNNLDHSQNADFVGENVSKILETIEQKITKIEFVYEHFEAANEKEFRDAVDEQLEVVSQLSRLEKQNPNLSEKINEIRENIKQTFGPLIKKIQENKKYKNIFLERVQAQKTAVERNNRH